MHDDSSYDVVVVGGRCAGASLARSLARAGRRVLVLDRSTFPSDRLSTHLLLVKGMYLLQEQGLLDRLTATGLPLADQMRFNFGEMWIDLPARRQEIGVEHVCAPRRTVLDHLLLQGAEEAGAHVRTGTTVDGLVHDGDRVRGVEAHGPAGRIRATAPLVVGADGPRSTVARLAGAAETRSATSSCQMFAYWDAVDQPWPEVGICPGHGLGVFPTHDGLTCVGVTLQGDRWPDYRRAPEETIRATLRDRFPTAAERVLRGRPATPFRGTNDLANVVRTPAGPGWALIGDASISSDPITGLGMSDAMHAARLLAECVGDVTGAWDEAGVDEALARYAVRRDEVFLPMFAVAERFSSFDWTADEVPALALGMSQANIAELAELTGVELESTLPAAS